jgi:pyruvate dehydrogenase E2 component (dihydrolipoamide acetyltransferase)
MSATDEVTVEVPDIGDFEDVPIIEMLVSEGDTVAVDDPLLTLESDKATMDVPAPFAGKVKELLVKVGDKVSQGVPLLKIEPSDGDGAVSSKASAAASDTAQTEADAPDAVESAVEAESSAAPEEAEAPSEERASAEHEAEAPSEEQASAEHEAEAPAEERAEAEHEAEAPAEEPPAATDGHGPVYASPAVRRLARERGIDLARVKGTGRKGRIIKADIERVAEEGAGAPAAPEAAPAAAPGLGLDLPAWPSIDFEKFGPIERQDRSRIQKISAPALARNWVMIPHVTHNDEADITELEAWRKQLNEEHARDGVKVTMVAFLIKASVATLKQFPNFNASLDGDQLIVKRYYNIGFAADTPGGLVVPVIKEADQKGLLDIARELTELSGKAREGKLAAADMQGSTFTISSLGGIGGTSFTPIVNAPEVAILGVTRSAMKPVWNGNEFVPRLMVPLSLSYDHRVIDGAAAARFVVHLVKVLSDLRRALL